MSLFITWALICIYFDIKLYDPAFYQSNIISEAGITVFILCLNLFWFYGLYHAIFTFYSYFLVKAPQYELPVLKIKPPAAILYTTKDDFQETALESCLKQTYNNFDVYILDDSSDAGIRTKIDGFVSAHPRLKLMRRENNRGFKAGNLNQALLQIGNRYEYFAVSDADSIFPEDFLEKLIPYFFLDKKIAFVQANQKANPKQASEFARIFSFNTDLHWNHYVPVKEQYGFMMFYGHGAVVRTSAWKEIGGFPEVASEDLAFSSFLREKDYQGVFARDVYCYEEFPLTYKRMRKRNNRWSKGAAEYLEKYFPAFLKGKNISWVEKIDVFVSAGSLLLALPFLTYIIVAAIILPYSQNIFKLNIPVHLIYPVNPANFLDFIVHIQYKVYWTFDFLLIMLITSTAQLWPVVIDLFKKPAYMVRYLVVFTYICLATVVVSSVDFIEYVVTKKAQFLVTGEIAHIESYREKRIIFLEVLFGLYMIYLTYTTANIWALIIGLSLVLNPLVLERDLESRALNKLLYLPFFLNIVLLILISRSLE
ncbi:MAG: glycosyltransferase family 2 protein [bacterium]|nr:glycosyltransferase family 2 protein [bacterium]